VLTSRFYSRTTDFSNGKHKLNGARKIMVKLIITGACGRTGSAILRLAAANSDFTVTHVLEAKGHPLVGTNITIPGLTAAPLPIETDIESVIADGDVIIDFTEPGSSLLHFRTAAKHGRAIVVGTTGFSSQVQSEMRGTTGAKAVISPNMSIGVNLLFNLAQKAAQILGSDYDAEIVEMHHNRKKDAPSGTALRLKDIITNTDQSRAWIEVTGREGMVGERRPNEIGILAVRAGDIVGEHTVFFVGSGERVEITHRAYSRDNFARGALAAAKWIVGKPEGIYDMNDVLGLS
jgi:4-hydroxy-tetrahydrodipicolinate reductase